MARLSKDDLNDRSRYKFERREVDIPELGGSVEVKTLSVAERDALPDLVDEDGQANASVDNLAEVFATVVSDPDLSADEAKGFLGDLPATALDRVIEQFGELLSIKEEDDGANRRDFRTAGDG